MIDNNTHDVLEEIKNDKFTERERKAMIFGAIFGVAEFVSKQSPKVMKTYETYVKYPAGDLNRLMIYVHEKRRSKAIERRLDVLFNELSTDDLALHFEPVESGLMLLAKHWELSRLRYSETTIEE